MLINAGPQSPFAHARQTFPYALFFKRKEGMLNYVIMTLCPLEKFGSKKSEMSKIAVRRELRLSRI